MLEAKPDTSPVIPPPIDIKQSLLWKLFFNKIEIILSTFFWFLFFSFALNRYVIVFFLLKLFSIFNIIFFFNLLSITIKHFLKYIEFLDNNLGILFNKSLPIIIGYF